MLITFIEFFKTLKKIKQQNENLTFCLEKQAYPK